MLIWNETRAGVSTTPTVSVVGIAPLTPGVSYTVWVVGVNSRGEGPESNKITFTTKASWNSRGRR